MLPVKLSTSFSVFNLALLGSAAALRSRSTEASTLVGYINVTAATLWTDSTKPRPVDAPALASPVQLREWLEAMTEADFLDLSQSNRIQTQALYGTRVVIVDEQDGWYQIDVPDQTTPKNSVGYPGWTPKSQVHLDPAFDFLESTLPFAQVTKAPWAPLYRDPLLQHAIMDISFTSRLPQIAKLGELTVVAVPGGGVAYVASHHVATYKSISHIPAPTGKDIVNTGMQFINQTYLWGGTMGIGYDCSGFTGTMYKSHGISLPRDSGPQAYDSDLATPVDLDDLTYGDLIFYANNISNPSSIHHVAMYAGDGKMLEAYASGIPVRLTPARLTPDVIGAWRYIK